MNLSGLSGIHAGDLMFSVAADNIANLDTPDYLPARVDLTADPTGGVMASLSRADEPGVDLAEQAAAEIEGKLLYTANARALSARWEAERSLFDMFA